jgi:hypothetical protein
MPPVNVADAAVAEAALAEILARGSEVPLEQIPGVVKAILTATSRVRFQPSTRQVVLAFDLAFGGDAGGSGPVE